MPSNSLTRRSLSNQEVPMALGELPQLDSKAESIKRANDRPTMSRFPYMSKRVNDVFANEKYHWDYVLLRPFILVLFVAFRLTFLPLKFVIHRFPFGFESYAINKCMSLGLKYFARQDAAELLIRHAQIEPLLYRHLLKQPGNEPVYEIRKWNGIEGDFSLESVNDITSLNLTSAHLQLAYEIADRFDEQKFLNNLPWLRDLQIEDHNQFSKLVLEQNRKHSFQILGITNIILLIVFAHMVFGDWRTNRTTLNSFGSDSILLWCLKHLYIDDPQAQITLGFFMQEVSHRGHYGCNALFSNTAQCLYYHIVFDEVAYNMLRTNPPGQRT